MSIKLLQALQDCVSVMANDLKGMPIIQPELQQAQKALADHFLPIEWDGSGLPPAGTICEYRVSGGQWFKCQIRYLTKPYMGCPIEVVMFSPHLKGEQTAVIGDGESEVSFRPIRTPEQIAEEELQIATQAIMADAGITDSALKDDPEAWVWAAALYKAGYRKQVAK